jgi:hypothetical protein
MAAGTFAAGTPDPDSVLGRWRVRQITYTGAAAYVAGGDVPPALGLRSIRGILLIGQNTASLGVIPIWNNQTGKLQLFQQTTVAGPLVEFSGNASTFVYTLLFISNDD